ncbi:aldose epimerase family protein [Kineococcus radiotolerans]|uniref:Aldose 1-epimerase n=1 Tax=Kineococcus radiotolerans (strain ATCC BAA-149 / DSM 14245 / SRS30216) TaxID=266940 RepID=A6W4N3_KINRD|nr:aldose epimerase family protein [Kineococcus radiotolerans]ABS01772.1 Aldose 1-epimerase [Kineococcus radiotolerans SRS30216 = ATCC BAA-149]
MENLTGTVSVDEDWGRLEDGRPVGRWVLDDGTVQVALVEHGARVQSVLAPDRDGRRADVVLGFADLAPYAGKGRSFGATVGRFANRIRGGAFPLDGLEVAVPPTDRGHAIHGGPHPFSEKLWTAHPVEGACGVRFSLLSPDGDNGFPGALSVHVAYALHDGILAVTTSATTDATTVVNLTNHAYWNLAGEGSGTVDAHLVQVLADAFLPVDEGGVPTGEFRPVAGTPFDLREPVPVGYRVELDDEQLRRGKGFDHCYVLADVPGGRRDVTRAAQVEEPVSGRTLEVWTDQPGVQFFTGGSLAGTLVGKAGAAYGPRDGLALEAQGFPDAPNHPEFPSTVLLPGEEFRTVTEFRFGVA